MLVVRHEQLLALQADLDEPEVEAYVELLRDDAAALDIDEPMLRERVRKGIGYARRLGAERPVEVGLAVALTAFIDPSWPQADFPKQILGRENVSLEAKLRLLLTLALEPPRED